MFKVGDTILLKKEPELLARGLQEIGQAPNTVEVEDYERMVKVKPMEF